MLYFAFRFKIATHTLATFVAAIRIVRAAMLAQTTGTNPMPQLSQTNHIQRTGVCLPQH